MLPHPFSLCRWEREFAWTKLFVLRAVLPTRMPALPVSGGRIRSIASNVGRSCRDFSPQRLGWQVEMPPSPWARPCGWLWIERSVGRKRRLSFTPPSPAGRGSVSPHFTRIRTRWFAVGASRRVCRRRFPSPSNGERILPTQVRAVNLCDLALHKSLVIQQANLRFMGGVGGLGERLDGENPLVCCGIAMAGGRPDSELNRLVEPAALGAARAVHVPVVRIDVAAVFATKDAVLAGGGFEPATAHLGINSQPQQRGQQPHHVSQNDRGYRHVKAQSPARQPADWWRAAAERCAIRKPPCRR